MSSDEYDKVEQPALEQLQSLGWNYIHGSELSPDNSDERIYFSDVVLESHLQSSIQRINPWISEENLRKVTRDLIRPQTVKQLVTAMEEATSIVEFFKKPDEVKGVRKSIKRTILDEEFGSRELVTAITDRFMELAKVKFK
ncbi:MAG: hypothetical protein HON68_01410 [Gammaproteobacteria bacterium]|jgi:type I site-specific restriction-modification system R (restriction) subunit|nr:hypothetical protein [Gammaproteobacteria bacterium]MBT3717854.1 hypothetical protein [Gammaproteobacteria bacterium]MBT3845358.1 hypothetical protein [Gammaproteobacteria bacterium]MBT3894410.1 hypothetical protein [Gammaproteobacteria bacterium]MBT4300684.1 hypothetical protein [Gammaproteobacteria bacterium]